MLDRWRHQSGHPRRRGPQTGGRGLVQVHRHERARRDDARLQHLRHRLTSHFDDTNFSRNFRVELS